MGFLEIRFCGGRYIGDSLETDFPDSYVKMKVGMALKDERVIYKTRTVKNSLHPEWNELFKFPTDGDDVSQMVFEVWKDNTNVEEEEEDEFLGCVRLASYLLETNNRQQGG